MVLAIGLVMSFIAVSAVVGYAVIAFFLRYLQTRTLKIFIVYRFAFGIFILLLMFLHRGTARSAPARPVRLGLSFPRMQENPVRLLTPTENRRLNELIGFLGITLAMLMALALLSYSPRRRLVQRVRAGARGASGAKLDRTGGRVWRRPDVSGVRLRGVSAADGHFRAGRALVSQPARSIRPLAA